MCGITHTQMISRNIFGLAPTNNEYQGTFMETKPLKDQNWLFHSVSPVDWERLLPHLEAVDLPLGLVLYEPGTKIGHVYFPSSAIVCLLYELEDGSSAEIAIVGNEGVVGISTFMGGEFTSSRAVVQSAGHGYRLKSSVILEVFNHSEAFMHLLLRYTQALITQMSQTAVCNRHHTLDKQLCRWLLLSLDRLSNNEVVMTQGLIANMLGVRRESVTEAACRLQKAGLIQYARGHIIILDRVGLEHRTCECYQVVKAEYDRLLPKKIAV